MTKQNKDMPDELKPFCINKEFYTYQEVLEILREYQKLKDMTSKNRQNKGEQVASSKLTTAEVIAIRASGHLSTKDLAEKYGVCRDTINLIRSGRTWKHLLDQENKKGERR